MAVMLLARYEVTERERFLEAFDGFEPVRRSARATAAGLVRSLDHSQTLVALIEFASREAAEAFAMSPERVRTPPPEGRACGGAGSSSPMGPSPL